MNELCVYLYFDMNNRDLMLEAIKEAKLAGENNEIPVGAVVTLNGEIIGRGHNTRETDQSTIGHAEINAIVDACRTLNCWHLDNCTIYVTCEPCPMCAGAIIQSRIEHVYFGTFEQRSGSFGSVFDLSVIQGFDHYPIIHAGVMEKECTELLTEFFRNIRK